MCSCSSFLANGSSANVMAYTWFANRLNYLINQGDIMKFGLFGLAVITLMLAAGGDVMAKDKGEHGHSKDKSARRENSNRQSEAYSERGLERAEERHRMHEERDDRSYDNQYGQQYGNQPRYRVENPVNNMIDNAANQLKQGINNQLPVPPPSYPQPNYPRQDNPQYWPSR